MNGVEQAETEKSEEKDTNINETDNQINSQGSVFEVGEFTHTQTDKKIPSAKLIEKVDRDEYLKLKNLAQKHGGGYGRFSERFFFKTLEDRDAFIAEVTGMQSSLNGNGSTQIRNIVAEEDLTEQQKLLQQFGESMGANVVFFNNANKDFHGAYQDRTFYFNTNSSRSLPQTFLHETFHFLKANNAELFGAMAKAASITEEQLENYLAETNRTDVSSKADITEEMIADSMQEILNRIAKKDTSLVERFFAWLQDTLSKIKDFFVNPKGKLTRAQYSQMADVFGKMAVKLKNAEGKKIFRYNNRTHILELANGESLNGLLQNKNEGSDNQGFFNLQGAKFSRINNDNVAGTLEENDEISQKVFDKYLTDGIMTMVHDTVEKEIGEHVDFSKMSDPIERDKARDSLPYIKDMYRKFHQLRGVSKNPAHFDRLAAKIEYARRCFDNDERIRNESVRQVDGNTRQNGIYKSDNSVVPANRQRTGGKDGGRIGLSRNVSGEVSSDRKHFLKLYDEVKKESNIKNRRSENEKQGVFNLDNKTRFSFAGKRALTAKR